MLHMADADALPGEKQTAATKGAGGTGIVCPILCYTKGLRH